MAVRAGVVQDSWALGVVPVGSQYLSGNAIVARKEYNFLPVNHLLFLKSKLTPFVFRGLH
jgi:hypothetical protein